MSDCLNKIRSTPPPKRQQFPHENLYKCKQCPFKATSLTPLTEHRNLTHTNRAPLEFQCSRSTPEPHRCYYCNFKTDLLVEYNQHLEQNPSDTPTKLPTNQICIKCKSGTYSRLLLLKHLSEDCVDDGEKVDLVLASLQGKTRQDRIEVLFYDPKPLQVQVGLYTGEIAKPYGRKTYTKGEGKRKMKAMMCEKCGRKLCNSESLKAHLIQKHTAPQDIEWFKCPECPYKAKLRSRFYNHVLYKHSDKEETRKYKCTLCSYRDLWERGVKIHYDAVHAEGADVQWFRCKFCPHKTRWRKHLKSHELWQHHGDLKMFQCELCPYRAKQKGHVKIHVMRKHTPDGEKERFQCEQCDYTVKVKACLRLHMLKTHTSPEEVDWLVCEECGYKTLEKSLLNKHVKKKH